MRYVLSVAIVVVIAVAVYRFIDTQQVSVQPTVSIAPEAGAHRQPGGLPEAAYPDTQPNPQPVVMATPEQKRAAAEQEQVIKQMARDYEDVRSDPELRAAHRQLMKAELVAYNEQILPVILEKADSAAPPVQ